MLSGAFRIGLSLFGDALSRADWIDDEQIYSVEQQILDDPQRPQRFLAFGSSRSQYAIQPAALADALGVAGHEAVNLAVVSGSAWEASVLLRRHPQLLTSVEIAWLDVAPWQFTRAERGLMRRFYQHANLAERIDAPQQRVRSTLDWFWPFVAQRRSVVDWSHAFVGLTNGHDEVPPATEAFACGRMGATRSGVACSEEDDRAMSAQPDRGFDPERFAAFMLSDPYEIREARYRQLDQLVETLSAAGAILVLHQPPMRSDLFDWLDSHRLERERYTAFLERIRAYRSEGVRVEIVERPERIGLRDEDLLDYGHLGSRAASVYSRHLARVAM